MGLIIAYSAFFHYYALTEMRWFAAILANALYGLLFTVFAVTCHRLVLLDPESVARNWRPRWTLRETRFFLWIVGFWLVALVVGLAALTAVLNAWMAAAGGDAGVQFEWMQLAIQVPLFYVFGRLCMLFPATAVDQDPRPTLAWAWRLTRDNGWRLLIVVGALPWLFSWLVGMVYRSNATSFEWLLVSLLAMALFAVEVAAVSISYRELTA